MKKQSLFASVLAVASFAGVAVAGTPAPIAVITAPTPQPVAAPAAKALDMSLLVGYASNYDFRGIIPQADNDGMNNALLGMSYKINEKTDLVGSLGYKANWDKPNEFIQNESTLNLGLSTHCTQNLTSYIGYRLMHGGLAGAAARDSGAAHSITQELAAGLRYDIPGVKGLYVAQNVSYAFNGLTGWWFDTSVGYERAITAKLKYALTGTLNAASSYFPQGVGCGGWQSAVLRLALPYQMNKVVIEPYVSANWLGSAGIKNFGHGDQYKNMGWIGGVNVSYEF